MNQLALDVAAPRVLGPSGEGQPIAVFSVRPCSAKGDTVFGPNLGSDYMDSKEERIVAMLQRAAELVAEFVKKQPGGEKSGTLKVAQGYPELVAAVFHQLVE